MNYLENPENERFFGISKENSLTFEIFETKGVGGGDFFSCLEKTKYERFLFCKHPLSEHFAALRFDDELAVK